MEIKEVVGIDVSKSTVDVFVHGTRDRACFGNTPKGLGELIERALATSARPKEEVFFIFEHTGIYSYQLADALSKKKLSHRAVSGLEIKKSLGIARGWDDSVDARRIALYGYGTREELRADPPVGMAIKKLKALSALRKRMVRERAGHIAGLGEQKQVLGGKGNEFVFGAQRRTVRALGKEILAIESEIGALIDQDRELKALYAPVLSVKGVGPVTAVSLIVHTNKSAKFATWRKFAPYCGTAPFPYRSGSSIRGRTKVSNLANKEVKSLLSMCALSAIKHDPEMKPYFEKRTQMGKHKMSTLNIIRNKLVARIFAVANRGTEYVDILKYTC